MDVPDEVLAEMSDDEEMIPYLRAMERSSRQISLALWDFAGQEVYYTTHQVTR